MSWIIYWINLSLDFIPWHFIFISNMVLIFLLLFLVILIFFLIEIVFQFHPLWFVFFFFLCQIWFCFFSNLYFLNHFFKKIISYLSLIILVGLEFYIVFFFFLPFMLGFGLMICVINFKGWIGFASVIFNYFKIFHPLSLSSLKIDFLCFLCFGFFCEFDFSFLFCT